MDSVTLVMILVGAATAFIVFGIISVLMKQPGAAAEQRLDVLTHGKQSQARKRLVDSLLRPPSMDPKNFATLEHYLPSAEKLKQLFDHSDVSISFKTYLIIMAILGVTGLVVGIFFLPPYLAPVSGGIAGALPIVVLKMRKEKRIQQFMEAMPEAVELLGRALRAGHGLASGMQLVSQEMKGALAEEFRRVFEEQNYGIPVDEALRGLAERIPTMDVRFLVTAIIIQRQTGGDLAEILDKIGRLIRERFELKGQVKALTAEGRLSGAVLMALPPGILAFLAATNPTYVMPLINTELGTKLLGITVVFQILGALAIKKIVAIKV